MGGSGAKCFCPFDVEAGILVILFTTSAQVGQNVKP